MMHIDGSAERERWAASAELWDRWADPMADMADKLNQPLLDAAEVAVGHKVLDLASGAGEPALSAARRAGPQGFVIGTDLVPGMLTGAVRRAATAEPRPVFAAADMTSLPFAAATFDAIVCRFGIMFVPDAVGALAEVRRVLKPGSRAAFMVWGACRDNALFEIIGGAVRDLVGAGAAESLTPLFRYAEPDSLNRDMLAAGLAEASEIALKPVRKAPAGQPFWRPTLEMLFGPQIAGLTTSERAALEAEITKRFAATAQGSDIPLAAHVRIGVARA